VDGEAAEIKWPKGQELAERMAVACKLGKLQMRDHYQLLAWMLQDPKLVEGQLRLLAAEGLDIRDPQFTFKAFVAASATPAKKG
jgi:hypothetical protein